MKEDGILSKKELIKPGEPLPLSSTFPFICIIAPGITETVALL